MSLPALWGPYAGSLGWFLADWSRQWTGIAGAWMIWAVGAGLYAVVVFRITPQQLASTLPKRAAAESDPLLDSLPPSNFTTEQPFVADVAAPAVDWSAEPAQPLNPMGQDALSPPWDEEDDDALEPTLLVPKEPVVGFTAAGVDTSPIALELEPTPVALPAEKVVSLNEPDYGSIGSAFDPRRDLSGYQIPPLDLLNAYGSQDIVVDPKELEANKDRIVETLSHYKIDIAKIKATVGPTVTLYEIVPAAGVRISKIKSLEDDIALSLSALGIRIIAPIPGKGTIGIEVPNRNAQVVSMRSVLASERFQTCGFDLPVALGKTISNEVFVADLAKMPHLLMAGATGQGKSVGLNAILASILYKKHPAEVKFVLVDPKKVELTLYNKIERHFLAKLPGDSDAIITDTSKVINTLNSLCVEMDQRYDLLKVAMVRNIKEYNEKFVARKLNPENGHRYLPYIVLVVDEFADLIMTAGKEVETPIARLAQLARAIGIHLIIATQRPSVNVITGIIKANFPARIAFKVSSKIDSRTILDAGGADQLIGRGDLLFSAGNDLVRIQCAFLDTPEVESVCEFIGDQKAPAEPYILPEALGLESGPSGAGMDPSDRDEHFEEAARVVVIHQQGSASLLQRKLKLGYNRAGRLVDQLEAAGIIGPFEGSKARQVLISDEYHLEQHLNALKGK
jgi:S-DNA-T family DNA segregation ATPase FtsK/SpoIIIE